MPYLSARFDLYVPDCQGGSWPGLFAPQVLIYGNVAQVLQVFSAPDELAEYGEIGREAYPFSQDNKELTAVFVPAPSRHCQRPLGVRAVNFLVLDVITRASAAVAFWTSSLNQNPDYPMERGIFIKSFPGEKHETVDGSRGFAGK